MKKVFGFLIATLLLASCTNNGFQISGSIDESAEGSIALKKIEGNEFVTIDSTQIKNGKFAFKGKVNGSVDIFYVIIEGQRYPVQLFVENTKISVAINLEDLSATEVKGSATHDIYDLYIAEIMNFKGKLDAITQEYRDAVQNGTANEELKAKLTVKINKIYEEQDLFIKEFAIKNYSNLVGLFVGSQPQITQLFDDKELTEFIDKVPAELQKNIYFEMMNETAQVIRSTAIGQPLVDFTMNDTEGNPITVSEIDAKLLLIDFWAAWCSPCRAENPNVVKLYADYKSKGLEILGVSFDRNQEDWIKAIKDDGITWLQVSDLKYWKNEAGKLYGIKSIPATVLVYDGKIVAKNLRGEELRKKVAELLD